jgi:hypothetical protein
VGNWKGLATHSKERVGVFFSQVPTLQSMLAALGFQHNIKTSRQGLQEPQDRKIQKRVMSDLSDLSSARFF